MNKTAMLFGTFVLSLSLSPAGLAGQQLGDNATIIVPAGTIKNMRQVLVVKGAPKPAATKVGNCGSGEVHLQDADLVDRPAPAGRAGRGGASVGPFPTVPAQVAVVFPGPAGFKELKTGWRLGSYRGGGSCGPGYDVYVAHIIAIESTPATR
jgi:hypothetical protein